MECNIWNHPSHLGVCFHNTGAVKMKAKLNTIWIKPVQPITFVVVQWQSD